MREEREGRSQQSTDYFLSLLQEIEGKVCECEAENALATLQNSQLEINSSIIITQKMMKFRRRALIIVTNLDL